MKNNIKHAMLLVAVLVSLFACNFANGPVAQKAIQYIAVNIPVNRFLNVCK